MRKVSILAVLLYVTSASFAQTSDAEADAMINLLGVQKREAVSKLVYVATKDSATFWKIYDEYEIERKAIGKEKYSLLEKYAQHYGTMDAETMDDIMNDMIALTNKTDKLQATYYGKVKKAAGVKAASQFLQLEYYLSAAIRAAILEEIPFIGELDK